MADDDKKEAKDSAHEERKRKRIKAFRKDHPYGTCLLARDNPHNRGLFPDGPFGKIKMKSNHLGRGQSR
jgi:hypothetical protein